ncbi:C25 family cysteine peptidase [Thermodesulfobacteriota bacterium]
MFRARSWKRIIIPSALCFAFSLVPVGAADQSGAPGLTIDAKENMVRVELVTGDVGFVHASFGSSRWTRPVLRDYEHDWIHEPGHPMLPVKVACIEVPRNVDILLSIDELVTTTRRTGPVVPAPPPLRPDGQAAIGIDLPREYEGPSEKDLDLTVDSIYESNIPYPREPARLVESGIMSGTRYARVLFYPVRYSPSDGTLLVHSRIAVTLTFKDAAEAKSDSKAAARLPFPDYGEIEAYRVAMSRTGMAEITYADLNGAGFDLAGMDPDYFQVYNMGQQVAIRVSAQGGGVGSFGPGDVIRFYAYKNEGIYSDVNLYWLIVADAPGLRMAEDDGTPGGSGTTPADFPATVHAEENISYAETVDLGDSYDNWFWGFMMPGSPSDTYTIDIPNVADSEASIDLTLRIHGYSSEAFVLPDHHVIVSLNGVEVDDFTFDGYIPYLNTWSLPQDMLTEGTNELVFQMPGDTGAEWDFILVDYFEITYRRTFDAVEDVLTCSTDITGVMNRIELAGFSTNQVNVYDITSPEEPVAMVNPQILNQGGSYKVIFDDNPAEETDYYAVGDGAWLAVDSIEIDSPSALWETTNQADYIVISHDTLLPEASQLAAYRETRGLTVELVDVADIYDEFNYGIFDADAIRDFLAYAYFEWSAPAPVYVVLFGDGHFDYKDYAGLGEPMLIPPRLRSLTGIDAPSDNFFVCVDGDDNLQDMIIGRIPAATAAQAQTVIDKITGYETDPDTSDFDWQVLMVTDDDYNNGVYQDFRFVEDAEELIADYLCSPHLATRVYQETWGTMTNTMIRNAIDDGKYVMNYIGHGAITHWAEEILTIANIDDMNNDEKLPVLFSAACMTGYFIHPMSSLACLDEELLRRSGAGTVACITSGGFTYASQADFLETGLFDAIFTANMRVLGDAFHQAHLYVLQYGEDENILNYYNYMGDPALTLPSGNYDADGDGVPNIIDNCPYDTDPDQENLDGDCQGDACDADADGDGFDNDVDCDDQNTGVNPGLIESLAHGNCEDGLDNDCDTFIDMDDPGCAGCPDADGDFYMDDACGGSDCDDSDPNVNPGTEESVAEGNCEDGVDNDCDAQVDAADPGCGDCPDADGDFYTDEACGGADCDDADPAINPGAQEIKGDGIDSNCSCGGGPTEDQNCDNCFITAAM